MGHMGMSSHGCAHGHTRAHTAACAGSGRARHHDEDDYGVYDHYGDVTMMMMMMMMSRSPPTCGPVATVASGRAKGHARRTCTDARRTRETAVPTIIIVIMIAITMFVLIISTTVLTARLPTSATVAPARRQTLSPSFSAQQPSRSSPTSKLYLLYSYISSHVLFS